MRRLAALLLLAPALAAADTKIKPPAPDAKPADPEIEMPAESARPAPPRTAALDPDAEPAPGTTAAPSAPPIAVTDSVASPAKPSKWLEPYGAIAGGMHLQSLNNPPNVQTAAQNPTVAISRIGLRGGAGEHVTFASEWEAALGGPQGYGASVWEGQAALDIRDQWVRYANAGFAVAVGRISDPASFDYVSAHMGDLLYADMYTRDPLLYSGADRGNGLFASYAITDNLTVAGTFHSTNPTGITGTLEIGGKLQPFDRPFYLAAAQVGNSQNNLPDQNLHIYFGSPSLLWKSDMIEAKAEVQMYSLDTQESISTDQTIRGYNFRLGAKLHVDTPLGKLSPFANVSRNKNEILDPVDSKYRLPDLFKSYTVSTGFDLDVTGKTGIGFSYAMVDTREPDQHVREHYLNLGTSYWIEDSFAIGLRGSVFAQQISGETMTTGSRSLFLTARLVLN